MKVHKGRVSGGGRVGRHAADATSPSPPIDTRFWKKRSWRHIRGRRRVHVACQARETWGVGAAYGARGHEAGVVYAYHDESKCSLGCTAEEVRRLSCCVGKGTHAHRSRTHRKRAAQSLLPVQHPRVHGEAAQGRHRDRQRHEEINRDGDAAELRAGSPAPRDAVSGSGGLVLAGVRGMQRAGPHRRWPLALMRAPPLLFWRRPARFVVQEIFQEIERRWGVAGASKMAHAQSTSCSVFAKRARARTAASNAHLR